MSMERGRIVSEGLLKGAFDVFDAMLSHSFRHSEEAPDEADETVIAGLIATHPVALRCRIEEGLGSVAILLQTGDASKIASLSMGGEAMAKASLDANDTATLSEVAEAALGGGVMQVFERAGLGIKQLAESRVEVLDIAAAADFAAWFGGPVRFVGFAFSAPPDFDSDGVLLFSRSLEEVMPDATATGKLSGGPDAGATLSPEEMNDILSGFDAGAPSSPRSSWKGPDNLDMVLDIRLQVTARLGRVELPIGDIINLGPGSILEMGHMVDEPVDLYINDKLIARGDVVVVDEKFGLRITEIVSAKERIESLR